jgi:hypothetical protein
MTPLMEDLAQQFPALPEAAKNLPGPVFQQWLKLRRQGADQFFPAWRDCKDKKRRVEALDLGARLKAAFN